MILNRWIRLGAGSAFFLICGVAAYAQDISDHNHNPSLLSPYMGEETREIRTLSEEDIRQLESGEGWGLAKAAELNGMPGPAHLLEMVDHGEMHLNPDQLTRVRYLYQEMRDSAIPVGLILIEQERDLNVRFATNEITENELRRLLTQISETTANLRYIHLSAHLETLRILNPHQIETYNRIRGYSAVEPSSAHKNG